MDNSFVFSGDCSKDATIEARVTNFGDTGVWVLRYLNSNVPDQTFAPSPNQSASFVVPAAQLQADPAGLPRFILFVRPQVMSGGTATIMLRVKQGNPPQALGGTVADEDGHVVPVPHNNLGEVTASDSVPNGTTAAFSIAMDCM